MISKKYDVVGIGCSAVDYLGVVPKIEKLDAKMWMDEFTQQGGGLVATALVALARLGARTHFVGKVGDDDFGRFIADEFKKEGVACHDMVFVKGMSARFAFCVSDRSSGARTIFVTPHTRVPYLKSGEVKRRQIAEARFLHVDGYEMEAQLRAAHIAREGGVTVVLDAEKLDPKMPRLVRLSDVIIASEDYAEWHTSKHGYVAQARSLFGEQSKMAGNKIVVVTAGIKGSYTVSKDGEFHTPAFKVKVVDTTGCGDVFHGAYIYGLLRQWDLRRTAEFASAVAALKCRALGGRAGIPTLEETVRFLKSKPKRLSP
jgi:ribokinase